MTLDIFKLSFNSPLHLSRGKLGTYESSDDVLHSDTLKSALFVTALQLYGDSVIAENLFDQFQVSSAFPYEGETHFFPRPLSFHPAVKSDVRKSLKRVKYIRQDYFGRMLAGEKDSLLIKSGLLEVEQPEIWKKDNTQRVVIDRVDVHGTPFFLEKLYPVARDKNGLFFIIHINDKSNKEAVMEKLFQVAQLLGENGIGLQRSLGNGCFSVKRDTLNLDFPENSTYNASISLSLYRPQNEIDTTMLESGFYDFQLRGGWVASPENDDHRSIRKKSVYMFSEGSVFCFRNNPMGVTVHGDKIDLSPIAVNHEFEGFEHPVWREGRGIFLPINL